MRAWDIPSPCVGICRLDADSGLCQGCHRTIAEISAWPRLDAPARLALLDEIARRQRAEAERQPAGGAC
ncbi:hypothetical protein EDC65_3750 [Stella humosa]|uniref:Fe-S protein YdhL (DUF1289 family) n=1 Tax=Stella humosa TaxID=94 RepID=A0A3N1L1C9_9PROT|nr:DUF1289 domain-containing protein [Stella humosa]ROP84398.1 hypothetical protein EDC65_3750 [Stella humosa]BBK33914.1 hypothetical protein STHU_45480 [Stella humosa]